MQFGALVDPRENPNSGRYEWQIGLLLTEEEAAPVLAAISEAAAQRRAENPKFPPDAQLRMPYSPAKQKVEGVLTDVEGSITLKFKRQASIRDKMTGGEKQNTPPAIYDGLGRLLNGTPGMPVTINSGSTGKVVYSCYAYDQAGSKGVTLQLRGFQLFELAKNDLQLAPIEGGFVPDEMDDLAAALAG